MSIDSNYYESPGSFIYAYYNRGRSDADLFFNVRGNTSKGGSISIVIIMNSSDNYEVKVANKKQ